LQADTDEQLEKGSDCIERMLRGESVKLILIYLFMLKP
jgi:hypothetical protein